MTEQYLRWRDGVLSGVSCMVKSDFISSGRDNWNYQVTKYTAAAISHYQINDFILNPTNRDW